MKAVAFLQAILCLSFLCCGVNGQDVVAVKNENYEVNIAKKQKAVLVLFPCYPCDISHTKREAFFLKDIEKQGVTTILMGFNKKIYLKEEEKVGISKEIKAIFDSNKIKGNNVFIGGFSSGGNVALLMAEYLFNKKNGLEIKGVFVVDSPVDLERLYYNAKNDIDLDANEGAKNEGVFLSQLLESELGVPSESLKAYQTFSPVLISKNALDNLPNHKKYKIRLYTEPAIEWHQKNRQREYKNTNSWMLENFYDLLRKNGNTTCELVKTENKGVRANGDVHPHSWSIVDQKGLLEWMKN